MKQIPGYSNYSITENGIVYRTTPDKRNRYKNREMSVFIGQGGYLFVQLRNDNNERKSENIHRLVAMTYVPNDNPEKNKIVHHKDGNIYNNNYKNLMWCDYSLNNKDPYERGTQFKGMGKKCIVINTTSGEKMEFDSIADCERYFNLVKNSLVKYLLGTRKTNPLNNYIVIKNEERNYENR